MRPIHSKTHIVFLTLLVLTLGIIDSFPIYGEPAFRYTGSDPKNLVWNFGWPIPWLIYDEINPPYWFAWLGTRIRVFYGAQGVVILVLMILLRMIREKDPRDK